jgi:diguanylate cyclase (GGDEF)-like protein
MYLRFQDDQITNDILTGLNNRYALDSYIEDKMRVYHDGAHSGKRLYLILMDVNSFKEINDDHGHIEGDKALKTVATTLKSVGQRYRSSLFIARYGGDEFAAVLESSSEKNTVKLCNDIKDLLATEASRLDYVLTMGVGYALYTGGSMTLDSLYTLADKALYEDKDRMKGHAEFTIVPGELSEVE